MKTNIFKTVRRSAAVLLGALMVTPSWSQVNKELTMTANVETTINLKRITETGAADNPLPFIDFEYKKNDADWAVVDTTAGVSLAVGDVVSFRAKEKVYQLCSTTGTDWSYYKFSSSSEDNTQAHVMLSGNIMSMLAPVGFADSTSLKVAGKECGSTFIGLFQGLPADIEGTASDPKLVLPATTLTDSCYTALFRSNHFLTVLPKLPATTLAKRCYDRMFDDCKGLKYAPELPATTMAQDCYLMMFYGCDYITKAPALPATTLAKGCYSSMFTYCKSISETPELPATTLAESCYSSMFQNCTGLTKAGSLPASTMAKKSYYYMFAGCTSLKNAPALNATTLADSCYMGMFRYDAALENIPSLPAMVLANGCYYSLFSGCKSAVKKCVDLSHVTTLGKYSLAYMYYDTEITEPMELPWETLAEGCYEGLFQNSKITRAPALPASTLVKGCYKYIFAGTPIESAPLVGATTLLPHCYEEMFSDCKKLKTAPSLPATTLANACYMHMFKGCESLISAPSLNATILADSCYYSMFLNCSSLESAPVLPAMQMKESCYREMFAGCTKLKTAPALPATTLDKSCYRYMFSNTGITSAPALPATALAVECYKAMFINCKALTTPPALSATTLADSCYMQMFEYCEALATAPELSATTLTKGCYMNMFHDCFSLVTPPVLPATLVDKESYANMFYGCKALESTPVLTHVTRVPYGGMQQMFRGCTSLTTASDLSGVTDIGVSAFLGMFRECTSLKSGVDLSSVVRLYPSDSASDEDKATYAYSMGASWALGHMYEDCKSLTSIGKLPNNWYNNAPNTKYLGMPAIFKGCSSLGGHVEFYVYRPSYAENTHYAYNPAEGNNWTNHSMFAGTKITSAKVISTVYDAHRDLFIGCETIESVMLDVRHLSRGDRQILLGNTNHGVLYQKTANKDVGYQLCDVPSTWIVKEVAEFPSGDFVISEGEDNADPYTYWKDAYADDPDLTKDVIFMARRDQSLTNAKAATVCFPAPVTINDIDGGGSFYEFTGVQKNEETNKWEAVYTEYTEAKLKSNEPYIFVPTTDEKILISESLTLDDTSFEPKAATVGDWTFQGVYKKTNWNAENANISGKEYGFAAENRGTAEIGDFVQIGEGAWQNAGTAYLKYTGSDDPFKASTRGKENLPERITVVLKSINGDGQTTAIGSIDTKTGEISFDDKGDWYTISGNRLSEKPSKTGVYIHNGKKVIIK